MIQRQIDIRVAIVEDHPIVVEGLKNMLEKEPGLSVTGIFEGTDGLIAHIAEKAVDIVLLDISLPETSGLEVCKLLKLKFPDLVILILSNHTERSMIMQAIQNGAKGYLLKNASVQEIISAILGAIQGQVYYSKEVQEIIAQPSKRDLMGAAPITKREKQILLMIAEGKTSVQIAQELFLSNLTVDTHRKNMLQKFGVKNTAELIIEATRQQIL